MMVSVCVIIYQNFEYLRENLDSIFQQDYPHIQLILSDDGSKNWNENQKWIQDYINTNKGKNIDDVVISHLPQNMGIVKNVNNALLSAKGEWIKILAADDMFSEKESISKIIKYATKQKALILSSPCLLLDEAQGKIIGQLPSQKKFQKLMNMSTRQLRYKISTSFQIAAPGVFMSKKLFDNYGVFNEEYKYIEDTVYWLHLLKNEVRFQFCNYCAVIYRQGSGITANRALSEKFYQERIKIWKELVIPNYPITGWLQLRHTNYLSDLDNKYGKFSTLEKLIFIFKYSDMAMLNQIKKIIYKVQGENGI